LLDLLKSNQSIATPCGKSFSSKTKMSIYDHSIHGMVADVLRGVLLFFTVLTVSFSILLLEWFNERLSQMQRMVHKKSKEFLVECMIENYEKKLLSAHRTPLF
ncbi:hypothetical protein BOX15_Mlig014953g1, partial [Macrostomum lignano]